MAGFRYSFTSWRPIQLPKSELRHCDHQSASYERIDLFAPN